MIIRLYVLSVIRIDCVPLTVFHRKRRVLTEGIVSRCFIDWESVFKIQNGNIGFVVAIGNGIGTVIRFTSIMLCNVSMATTGSTICSYNF